LARGSALRLSGQAGEVVSRIVAEAGAILKDRLPELLR
jgi:hypothetical protein